MQLGLLFAAFALADSEAQCTSADECDDEDQLSLLQLRGAVASEDKPTFDEDCEHRRRRRQGTITDDVPAETVVECRNPTPVPTAGPTPDPTPAPTPVPTETPLTYTDVVAAAAYTAEFDPLRTAQGWAKFTLQAVALQRCAAERQTQLDPAFWGWLDSKPEILLSLSATSIPVVPQTWTNMGRLYQEFRTEIEEGVPNNGGTGRVDIASFLVGHAYLNREGDVDRTMSYTLGRHGDMDDQFSTSERPDLAGGDSYARGPLSKGDYAVEYARRRRSGQKKCTSAQLATFPDRDRHPTVIEAVRYHIDKTATVPVQNIHFPAGSNGKLNSRVGCTGRCGNLLEAPWVLSPFVYFAPNRECDWAYANHPGGAGKNVRWYHYNKAIFDKDPIPGLGLCKASEWHPRAMPRIPTDGRVCGGMSFLHFATFNCLGRLGARVWEPGHSAAFDLGKQGDKWSYGHVQGVTGTRSGSSIRWPLNFRKPLPNGRHYQTRHDSVLNEFFLGRAHKPHPVWLMRYLEGLNAAGGRPAKLDVARLATAMGMAQAHTGNARNRAAGVKVIERALELNKFDWSNWAEALLLVAEGKVDFSWSAVQKLRAIDPHEFNTMEMLVAVKATGTKNYGRPCWVPYGGCRDGPCPYCGTGSCCRNNFKGKNPEYAKNGCPDKTPFPLGHKCVPAPSDPIWRKPGFMESGHGGKSWIALGRSLQNVSAADLTERLAAGSPNSAAAAVAAVVAAQDAHSNVVGDALESAWFDLQPLLDESTLATLVDQLPVVHANEMSQVRWRRDGRLLERCFFTKVADLAELQAWPAATAAIERARRALTKPWEDPKRVTGPAKAETLTWTQANAALAGSDPSATLPNPPEDAGVDAVMARLRLDAEEHACHDLPPQEEEDEEELANEEEAEGAPPPPDGDAEADKLMAEQTLVESSSDSDCAGSWLVSDAAYRLQQVLRELHLDQPLR